jgi:glyoxylate/hydroxypyruvate reductase A
MDIALVGSKTYPETLLPRLREALPQDRFHVHPQTPDPASVSVALVAAPQAGEVAQLPNLKLIQCLWMGVDALVLDRTLPKGVPVARMVDPSMVAAMTESVLHAVIDFHRCFYLYRRQQAERRWTHLKQFMAAERTVGFLGMGELGADASARLVALGFNVCGWSRSPKSLPGVKSYTGESGLAEMLPTCDMLVCLLPLTPQTRGLLSRKLFDGMKDGAALIHFARGSQMVTKDVVAALDSGKLAHAYLDVFETEPLPADDPLWAHPKITVTPHIAALTEPRTAMAIIAENVARVRRGETPLHLVDFSAGY